MSWYVRTQTGWGLRGILLSAFILLLYRAKLKAGSFSSISGSLEFWPLLVSAIVLALVVMIFTVMTVTVNDENVEVSMGLEVIRARVPVSEIDSIEEVRIPWHSVGFKKISLGWLYSVAISGGVDIRKKNGKRLIIGTDDPEGLMEAIRLRMAGNA